MTDQEERYDIFVSYARPDRERVLPMIAALEAPGWRVFWDHDIPPGWTWDEYIGAKLDEARVVLAVWSKESVRSEFVRTEASRARRRRALVPVRIDDIEPPVEFERVHAADLIDWTRVPQAALPEALHLEVTRRLAAGGQRATVTAAAAATAGDTRPELARSPTVDDDAAMPAAGLTLQQAQDRIRELGAARKMAMAELFAAQEALRASESARDMLVTELKAVREALGETGRKPAGDEIATPKGAPVTPNDAGSLAHSRWWRAGRWWSRRHIAVKIVLSIVAVYLLIVVVSVIGAAIVELGRSRPR